MTNIPLPTNYLLKPVEEKHLPEIMDIFNEAILHSTALYEYETRTLGTVQSWYRQKLSHHHPLIGIFNEQDSLLGFATYGTFREKPAYKYTVEHSVYVRSDSRGKGLGTILLREIVKKAEEQDYHVIIGGIDASNSVSIKLHEKEGFTFCGLIKQSGYKFGKWLDLAFYQLILKTPLKPREE
jgi:phosphinothricin acetyltransferase